MTIGALKKFAKKAKLPDSTKLFVSSTQEIKIGDSVKFQTLSKEVDYVLVEKPFLFLS